ncbi:MAG: YggS family pyridoxal phosphate-dependent enzyme [candidate division NC10 bacterium]|nr:YggS family pyridoxal phosphate-dependent enzyme [candidate division NC10 bacterium]
MVSIKERLEEVKRRVAEAALRAGRDPEAVELVAVSKTVDVVRIAEGIQAGIRILGENRVQEAEGKIAALGRPVKWHLVGHLQTNKAKLAVSLFDFIHSLDSIRLAEALERHAQMQGKVVPLLVEVNLGGEESKSGISPEGLPGLLRSVSPLCHLQVRGLMAIPPFFEEAEKVRPYFRRLRELAEEISAMQIPHIEMRHLSMGMSHDFEIAIEEGATLVRIGTAIFGARG